MNGCSLSSVDQPASVLVPREAKVTASLLLSSSDSSARGALDSLPMLPSHARRPIAFISVVSVHRTGKTIFRFSSPYRPFEDAASLAGAFR